MKAGISTACLYPTLLEEALEALASRRVENIEVFINTHCELSDEFVKLMKSVKDKYNINIVSMHPFTSAIEPMIFTPYVRRLNDTLEYYKRYFSAMCELGANVLVFHGNKPQNPFPNKQYFENFARISETASEFGLILAQENVARCVSAKLDFLKEMSDYLGDCVRFNIDIKQAVRSGEDPFNMIDTLKGKIANVHFSDNSSKNDCLPYGEGTFNCEGFIKKLHSDGYDGNIIIELYNNYNGGVDMLAENYRNLQKLIETICK